MKPLAMAALAALFAFPAWANNCAPREMVTANLRMKFHEVQTHAGTRTILGVRHVVEMWASPAGSWTVIQTNPAGISCVLQGGYDWGPVKRAKVNPGEPG